MLAPIALPGGLAEHLPDHTRAGNPYRRADSIIGEGERVFKGSQ